MIHRTYELYVRRPNGHVQFQALTHAGGLTEVMAHVRSLLDTSDAESIEVRSGGDHLFTVEGAIG